MKKNWQKFVFIFLAILIVYLPFQVFAQEFLFNVCHFSAGTSFWLAHWYEFFILLFFLVRIKKHLSSGRVIALILIVFGLISAVFLSKSAGRGIEGFRFDLFFLLTPFIASDLPEKLSQSLIKIYLVLAGLISAWAIVERFLPVHYWQKLLNFSPDFGFGNYFVGLTPRSDSIFNGPSQLSNYLLLAAGLVLVRIARAKKFNWTDYLYYMIIILGLGFAYSRAAWIGLAVIVLLTLIFVFKSWSVRFKIIFISIIVMLIPILSVKTVSGGSATASILTHDTSQVSHEIAATTTLTEMKKRLRQPVKLLFGSGLSSAGPLVLKYHDGLISESWYLQILLEIGVIGLVCWLWLIVVLFLDMIKKNTGLAYGLIAVSIAAIFLHTFADSPATSWTLFALIGANLGKKDE